MRAAGIQLDSHMNHYSYYWAGYKLTCTFWVYRDVCISWEQQLCKTLCLGRCNRASSGGMLCIFSRQSSQVRIYSVSLGGKNPFSLHFSWLELVNLLLIITDDNESPHKEQDQPCCHLSWFWGKWSFAALSKNLGITLPMTVCLQDWMNFEDAGYKTRIILLCANPFSKCIIVNITAQRYRQTL